MRYLGLICGMAMLAVAPLRADLTFVVRTTAHRATVEQPPPSNPMFTMFGGLVVSTIVPPGGVKMTVTVGERGTRLQYDQAYLMLPAGAALLVRPDGSQIVIDPAARTYWRAGQATSAGGAGVTPDVNVTPTGEHATIAGLDAERSTLDVRLAFPGAAGAAMPGLPSELAISGDVWLAPRYARYARMLPALANGLAAVGMGALPADGLPVRLVMRSELFAGQEIESVVTSIAETTAAADLFEVPAGFKEVDPPAMTLGAPFGR